MTSPPDTATTGASRAIAATLELLEAASIVATRDAGAFFPQPVGVLVGLPALTSRTLAGAVYSIAVLVVSGDPLNSPDRVDRLYALADDVAIALRTDAYAVASWRSSVNAEPLPALELSVIVTVTESEV